MGSAKFFFEKLCGTHATTIYYSVPIGDRLTYCKAPAYFIVPFPLGKKKLSEGESPRKVQTKKSIQRIGLGCPPHQPNQEEQEQGTDNGGNDRTGQTTGQADAQYAKQPAANECAENTDDNVAEQTKTIALANDTGEPAADGADDEREN